MLLDSEIHANIMDLVEHPEAAVVVLCYAAATQCEAGCNADRSRGVAYAEPPGVARITYGKVCATWGHDAWC